jgi:hypothetical protein
LKIDLRTCGRAETATVTSSAWLAARWTDVLCQRLASHPIEVSASHTFSSAPHDSPRANFWMGGVAVRAAKRAIASSALVGLTRIALSDPGLLACAMESGRPILGVLSIVACGEQNGVTVPF